MKRIFTITIILSLLLSLGACGSDGEEALSQAEAQLKSTAAELSSAEAEISELNSRLDAANDALAGNSDKIDELNAAIEELKKEKEELVKENRRLDGAAGLAESNVKELEQKISEMTSKIANLEAQLALYVGIKVDISDDEYIYMKSIFDGDLERVNKKDNTRKTIFKDGTVRYLCASPDKTRVIWSDFDFEVIAVVRMYDVAKDTVSVVEFKNFPKQRTVAAMQWLDNRYFLFVVQGDTGTIVRGGDVYVYDTETGKYQHLVANSDNRMQTEGFTVYPDNGVLFSSQLYEETYNFTEVKKHYFTMEEIYDLIKSGKTVDLYTAK